MTFAQRLSRARIVLGLGALVVCAAAFVLARDVAFSASIAPRLGPADLSLQAMSFNRLGALVVMALGAVGVASGAAGRPLLGWVPAAGFALMALQVLAQWRPAAVNWFGSVGSDFAFCLLLAVGFGVTAALQHVAADADRQDRAS